ncbi:unnamed protein product [Oikopleura dioica]|uniref:Tyrosine-protein phosphatase domain-containing protein n=1 Tax=Oikopleura dioica TaxID=34765 RepID=E4YBN4_OIKDI|nr:unnamed protein product [Oikopleura dioica]
MFGAANSLSDLFISDRLKRRKAHFIKVSIKIETGETRTVTLLHYLGWPLNSTPPSAKRLLEFRRKARRAGSPVVICPDGASRSGAYCLIDSLISAYSKGKEPKPAELLSALRDQRMKSIRTESQLNFVMEAMGEAAESALQN